jgi:sodium-dependent dicarboxylate transporter 2/3/5
MLPVATPPNAVVFSSGMLTVPDMVRAGFWMNLVGILLVSAAALLLAPLVLG